MKGRITMSEKQLEIEFELHYLKCVGAYIRKRRKLLRLTQSELVNKIYENHGKGYLSVNSLSRYEKQKGTNVQMRAITLHHLCIALETNLFDFFDALIKQFGLLKNYKVMEKMWLELDESNTRYFNDHNFSLYVSRINAELTLYKLSSLSTIVANQLMNTKKIDYSLISAYEKTDSEYHMEIGIINFFIMFLALNIPENSILKLDDKN